MVADRVVELHRDRGGIYEGRVMRYKLSDSEPIDSVAPLRAGGAQAPLSAPSLSFDSDARLQADDALAPETLLAKDPALFAILYALFPALVSMELGEMARR